MGRPKKERRRCDPEVCKRPVFCLCGLCTRHCQCPPEDGEPQQLLKRPAPARSSHDETRLKIRASVSEEKSIKNIFDPKGLLEAFPPNQRFLANYLPKVARSSGTITSSDTSPNYWGPLIQHINFIIESVCEIDVPIW